MNRLKLRRNIWLILGTITLISVLVFGFGNTRVIAYVTSDTSSVNDEYFVIENTIELFDDSVVHEVEVIMNDDTYETMIETYKETSEKDYFQVDVMIDGVLVEDVGIRLKGNLTLNSALGTMENLNEDRERKEAMMGGDDQPAGFEPPEGVELPDDFDPTAMQDMRARRAEMMANGELPEGMEPGEMANGPGGGFGSGQVPYLIKFDKFVDGQTYQGYTEIAIRTGDDSQMVEQVAYYAHETVGQVVPETSYGAISINNETLLYTITEHIDESYLERNFENPDGVLYKAGNFVSFEYLGDDPTLYSDSFEQKTNVNEDDLTYLIDFMQFVTESTDEDFEDQLGDWIDLESFIKLMALDNLLGNNDSFVGMGSNYYLYWDKTAEQFTMLSWDLNMAMGAGNNMGMNAAERPDNFDEEGIRAMREIMMANMTEDGVAIDQKQANGGGMGRSGNNVLKTRFFENEKFSAMYDEIYDELAHRLFGTEVLTKKVRQLAATYAAYDQENSLVDYETYDTAIQSILNFIEQRASQL